MSTKKLRNLTLKESIFFYGEPLMSVGTNHAPIDNRGEDDARNTKKRNVIIDLDHLAHGALGGG